MQTYDEMVDSGVPYIGHIPANWVMLKFAYLYSSAMGTTILANELGEEGTPVYSATEKDKFFGYIKDPKFVLKQDDLVIPARGNSIGHIKIVKVPSTSTQTTIYSKKVTDKVASKFVYYALLGNRENYFYFDQTAIPQITVNQVKNNLIPVPPMSIQQKITNYLDAETAQIDNLIAKQERLLELLEEKRRATITHAVTRGLNPNVQLKETNIPWLGQIPAHWNVNPLFKYVKENKRSNKGMVNENVLTLSYGKIKEKNLDNGGLMPESFETYQIVKPGDIILRLTDLQNDKTSLRVGHSSFEGIITSAYVDISSVSYKSKYLYYLLHAYDLMKIFYNLGAGLRQGMKFSDLKRLPAFGVEQDEQQQIIDYLESYERKTDELKQKIHTQITLLLERRTSLISHAVTGKIKI